MTQQAPLKQLVVVSHSRKLLESPDPAAWLATRLANVAERRAAKSVMLVDGDHIHPVLTALRHDQVVRFHSDGSRRSSRSNGSAADQRWHDGPLPPDFQDRAALRAAAIHEAAVKAIAAGWHVRWVVLMHDQDVTHEPCRLLHPGIPCGDREAHVETYGSSRIKQIPVDPGERLVVWMDTETTGTDQNRHVVIEYAAVVTSANSREVIGRIEQKIRIPSWAINQASPEALGKNGYTPEAWVDAEEPRAAFAKLLAWLPKNFRYAGHNVDFDRRFLAAEFHRHGLVEPGWSLGKIDTLYTARRVLKATGRVQSCRLEDLCAYYGIDTGRAHTAMADAEAARQVYLKMIGGDETTEATAG